MKKRRLTLIQKRAIAGILFISPWLFGFIAFYAKSLLQTIQFSLSEVEIVDGGGFTTSFTGLDNYIYALRQHGTFNEILSTSVKDMIIDVPLIIMFSLFVALILNQKFRGRTIVRAIFFLPVIMNAGAISTAIEAARSFISGGISPISSEVMGATSSGMNIDYYMMLFSDILIDEKLISYVVGAVGRISQIITASGVQIVIFIAALQSVPSSLYEVSKIEGATAYENFWKVTFPMVTPLILTNTVYTVVDSFVNSEVVNIAYTEGLQNYNYGLSAAMSLLSTGIVCIILIVVGTIISKRTFYYN